MPFPAPASGIENLLSRPDVGRIRGEIGGEVDAAFMLLIWASHKLPAWRLGE
jgi:hypothetical protein